MIRVGPVVMVDEITFRLVGSHLPARVRVVVRGQGTLKTPGEMVGENETRLPPVP